MAEFNEMDNYVVSGVETVKKGKGKMIAGITAGALVVAAGGCAAAYAASDYVKNQVKLTVSSPENYYAWVNEKNTEDFAKQISEQYRTAIDEMKSGQKSSVSLKYEASEDVKNLLIDEIGGEQEIIDIIKNFNDISISASAETKDDISSGNVSAAWNGENLVSAELAADMAAMNVMFRIPALTEQWIDIDFSDIYGYDDMNEAVNISEKFSKDPESVITPEELETEIKKYAALWNECISDVELEKKADIAVSDITVNYTIASVTIDEAKAKEISEKFINTVKEDEILKAIIVDRLEITDAEGYIADLDEALADIAEDMDENSDETVTFNTYIDPTGCIRGVSFETSDNNCAKFIAGKDGSEIRGEFFVSEDGEDVFKGILTAEDNGGKYSGALDMTADGETFSIEFADLETVDEKKGYMNGVLTFVIPPEIIDSEKNVIFSVSLSSDGSSQQISVPLDIDGTNYGTVVLDIASENGAEPSMPDKSGAFVINDETDAELSDYVERDKAEEFIKNILLKIGFSEEIAETTAQAVGRELYNDYSIIYDYDDIDPGFSYGGFDDDFDYDFDYDDDYDYDFDDFDYDPENDPYYNDKVTADYGQAYICVIDNDFESSYAGYDDDVLGYNAVNADINGNGTYTVKVTADTDGYRNIMGDAKPNGILLLGIEAAGIENADNAVMEIKNVKIDGKEYEISNAQPVKYEYDIFSAIIYMDEMYSNGDNIIDASSVGEWTDIEVTFEVKGIE